MSRETWLKEFYPHPASWYRRKPWLVVLEATLLKWRGFLPSSLRRHGVTSFELPTGLGSVVSCPCCERSGDRECSGCPVGDCGADAKAGVAVRRAIHYGDPKPGIKILRQLVREYSK